MEHTGLKLTHILYRREAAIEAKQPNVYLLIIAVLAVADIKALDQAVFNSKHVADHLVR